MAEIIAALLILSAIGMVIGIVKARRHDDVTLGLVVVMFMTGSAILLAYVVIWFHMLFEKIDFVVLKKKVEK